MENNTELSAETARIESRRQLINWILLISCAVIWGFSYFLIKHALVGFEPMEVAGIRMFAGGIALLPFLYQAFKKIPYNKYFWIFVLNSKQVPFFQESSSKQKEIKIFVPLLELETY